MEKILLFTSVLESFNNVAKPIEAKPPPELPKNKILLLGIFLFLAIFLIIIPIISKYHSSVPTNQPIVISSS